MQIFDIVLLALLGAVFVVSIIELGLSGYAVNATSGTINQYDPYTGYTFTGKVTAPAQFKYLVFCSVWSFVTSILLIVAPLVLGRGGLGGVFGIVTLVINFLSWVFWLAGFAALAALYNGANPTGIPGALLAFAIIAWLLYTAFLVINLLTATGVVSVDRFGYHGVFRKGGASSAPSATPMTTTSGATPAV